ncbi:bifunctional diguanylate cyclase/phosphodiesterase [Grimontia marina]|uniref:Phytochrome-like protein cph2 n=1 Tax=Grimontia marina TaxID=646534 RepID=A0A128FEH1_9GAMM|nr:EAL domain-containing protein [Grimontia marina]CZF84724.1 Phytochrome-like protein cph2 [Grimontia marina]
MSDFKINIIDGPSTPSQQPVTPSRSWKVAIIDDEASMHHATTLALKNVKIMGYPLSFIHAYSAKEGQQLLADNTDTAVILLDVVMEEEDSGLQLASYIRKELGNHTTQIVLRTGQPGYAPEESVIENFEINDYKTKNELTRAKLFSTLCSSIRSYQSLYSIQKSRDGLRKIIDSAANQFQERSLASFSEGILDQINALFDIHSEGIFCVSSRPLNPPQQLEKIYFHATNEQHEDEHIVVATSQKYQQAFGKNLDTIELDETSHTAIKQAFQEGRNVINGGNIALYMDTPSQWKAVIYIFTGKTDLLDELDPELLSVFIQNVALGLENTKFVNQLFDAAFIDEITGLHSRMGFVDSQVPSLLKRAGRLTLAMIDIDDFHQINESLGFDYGNKVLKVFGDALKQSLPTSSVVSRLHSDAFAVATELDEASLLNVLQTLQDTVFGMDDGGPFYLGVTSGIFNLEETGTLNNTEVALKRAEIALKQAKSKRRGCALTFHEDMEIACNERLNLINKLRHDLSEELLYLVFQPKVDLTNNCIIGAEALLRWNHTELGEVSPGVFVPIAEAAGLSFELDTFVFRSACKVLANHPELPEIAINISPLSLNRRELLPILDGILQQYGIDKHRISLEITEGCFVQGKSCKANIAKLHEQGWSLHLDDFGTGYSSFGYLLNLPVSVIKIDRIFTWGLSKCDRSERLLGGMVNMLKGMNKRVLIEGIETEEQLVSAVAAGLEMTQGYLFYKPLTLDDFTLALKEQAVA